MIQAIFTLGFPCITSRAEQFVVAFYNRNTNAITNCCVLLVVRGHTCEVLAIVCLFIGFGKASRLWGEFSKKNYVFFYNIVHKLSINQKIKCEREFKLHYLPTGCEWEW